MNRYLDIAPEVQEALANGKPVVALESTIISHVICRCWCHWAAMAPPP